MDKVKIIVINIFKTIFSKRTAENSAVLIVLISGLFAMWQYVYAEERQQKKVFLDKQVDVIVEVFDVLAQMDSASSEEEKKIAASKFWIIYQGKGRVFLDSKMFEALKHPADYVAECVMGIEKPKNIDCSNYTASMSITGFAFVAHQQMTNNCSLSLSEISQQDPWTPPAK